ncbi:VRR-NUC domain-containing protein [Gammaproteobacteria bacterium]
MFRRFRSPFKRSGVLREDVEQTLVAKWLREEHAEVLFTIAPNAGRLPIGVGVRLKGMGYLPGTPDLLIFAPRGAYHGLFVELKALKGGVVNPEQISFILRARALGYAAVVCRGHEAAKETISQYLGGVYNAEMERGELGSNQARTGGAAPGEPGAGGGSR